MRFAELDKKSPYNWLNDNIWMNWAYLGVRAPLLINSNWWCVFEDDKNVPSGEIKVPKGDVGVWQVRRAAWLVHRALLYRYQLER